MKVRKLPEMPRVVEVVEPYRSAHDEYNQKQGAFAERVVKLWRTIRKQANRK